MQTRSFSNSAVERNREENAALRCRSLNNENFSSKPDQSSSLSETETYARLRRVVERFDIQQKDALALALNFERFACEHGKHRLGFYTVSPPSISLGRLRANLSSKNAQAALAEHFEDWTAFIHLSPGGIWHLHIMGQLCGPWFCAAQEKSWLNRFARVVGGGKSQAEPMRDPAASAKYLHDGVTISRGEAAGAHLVSSPKSPRANTSDFSVARGQGLHSGQAFRRFLTAGYDASLFSGEDELHALLGPRWRGVIRALWIKSASPDAARERLEELLNFMRATFGKLGNELEEHSAQTALPTATVEGPTPMIAEAPIFAALVRSRMFWRPPTSSTPASAYGRASNSRIRQSRIVVPARRTGRLAGLGRVRFGKDTGSAPAGVTTSRIRAGPEPPLVSAYTNQFNHQNTIVSKHAHESKTV